MWLEKAPRGTWDSKVDHNNGAVVMAYNDNKVFHLISNVHDIEPVTMSTRWSNKQKKRISIPTPNAVTMYNRYMGGVDRMNENIQNYRVGIRSRKWWWPFFVFCMETAIHNAWRLFVKAGHDDDFLLFRRKIVMSYLQCFDQNRVGHLDGRPKRGTRKFTSA